MKLIQVFSIPFAWSNDAVKPISSLTSVEIYGEIPEGYGWNYTDAMLMLIFGGIPWQVTTIFCRQWLF